MSFRALGCRFVLLLPFSNTVHERGSCSSQSEPKSVKMFGVIRECVFFDPPSLLSTLFDVADWYECLQLPPAICLISSGLHSTLCSVLWRCSQSNRSFFTFRLTHHPSHSQLFMYRLRKHNIPEIKTGKGREERERGIWGPSRGESFSYPDVRTKRIYLDGKVAE